ncbi:MAG: hypothetical protein ACRD1N_03255, partial [Terriglobia bacterium]
MKTGLVAAVSPPPIFSFNHFGDDDIAATARKPQLSHRLDIPEAATIQWCSDFNFRMPFPFGLERSGGFIP